MKLGQSRLRASLSQLRKPCRPAQTGATARTNCGTQKDCGPEDDGAAAIELAIDNDVQRSLDRSFESGQPPKKKTSGGSDEL